MGKTPHLRSTGDDKRVPPCKDLIEPVVRQMGEVRRAVVEDAPVAQSGDQSGGTTLIGELVDLLL